MVNGVNQSRGSRSGFRDWVAQRATAILVGAYALFLIGYFLCHQPLYFAAWQNLFACTWMKVASFVVLLAILWHAWIGLWTVFTDYVKCAYLRLFLELGLIVLLLGYLAWGIDILWGLA